MAERYIFWFEELGQDQNSLVGKKCANLGEIAKIGLPVPPGFALSVRAYEEFLEETNAIQEIRSYLQRFGGGIESIELFNEASLGIRQIVESKKMPEGIRGKILSFYDGLCRKCNVGEVAVATRSAGPVSHPGQYETYLNVRGEQDLLEKIIKVWASSFNPRSLAFRSRKGIPLESDPIGVAVLKMVNARAAGVIFTADPNTGDLSRMILEANWGLGESVVGGESMPDTYIVIKESLQVCERKLGAKQKCVIFKELGVVEEETPLHKRSAFCLKDEEVAEVGRLAVTLEKHFGVPQDAEWAIDEDFPFPENIVLLQTRAAVIAQKKSAVDQVVDLMLKRF
ncbi:MAG: PEP/pyruvate-binding domain-containing protein [Thermodesulfobacteriota bacterium]|jgi:pyruvate,water dikinase